jgi:small subunit ribosomal protein S20
MPIIKSAKKRVRTARKAAIRNSKTKRGLKIAVKSFVSTLASGNKPDTAKAFNVVQSELDKAAKKGVLHKNKAARKKSQAARAANAAASALATEKTKPVKKKAAATSKTTAKKPGVKKSAPKKSTAKK